MVSTKVLLVTVAEPPSARRAPPRSPAEASWKTLPATSAVLSVRASEPPSPVAVAPQLTLPVHVSVESSR